MRELHTAIDIDAPPEVVWRILTDLEGWKTWNRFIPEASGTIAAGERLRIRIDPPDGRAMTFTPTVTMLESGRGFTWLGRLVIPRLFDGAHSFRLEPIEGGTRLVQFEHFRGLLVPLVWPSMEASTRAGFVQMNEDLKAAAEAAL